VTDSSLRSAPTMSLDERPRTRQRMVAPEDRTAQHPATPPVGAPPALHGPETDTEREDGSAPVAPVDGVAVVFFDPESGRPHLVFVSEGLSTMVGRRVDELLGGDPAGLFHAEGELRFEEIRRGLGLDRQRLAEEQAAVGLRPLLARERVGNRAPVDLLTTVDPATLDLRSLDLGALDLTDDGIDGADGIDAGRLLLDRLTRTTEDIPPRVLTATQELARPGRRPLQVHAAYTVVPSMTPLAPYVVAEFRDLEQPSAERLLADQAAVVRSLGRGYELGRVCHQVAGQVEQELGDGSRCWIAVRAGDGSMEPVLAGGLPFELVDAVVGELLALGQPLARRVVALAALSAERAEQLAAAGTVSLWYLPLVSEPQGTGSEGTGSEEAAGPDGALAGADGEGLPAIGEPVLRGVMVVATPRERPTRPQARALEHLAAVLHTAVEQATVEADLVHQTLHDPLTGLPNRALLVDRLGQVMARLERDEVALSVLLVDIDRFKTVNDTLGAEVGDQVLLEVAGRLLTAVRLGDTVGRLSSDQYLVMCAASKGELDAKAVARRILRSLAEPIEIGGGEELHITASVGVVVVEEPGSNPAAVISNAESALARATANGRGRMAMYEADHRHHQVERHITEQALHRAIGNDELVLHYQPLVEIRTGFMVGAEALVRWDRPGHGLVGPGAFIPIAEESELIIPLGRWIIDRVCQDLGHWPSSHGRAPMVTINLGARQLGADTLVPTVVSALQRNGLHPRRVGFEITESMEIRDAEAAVINLNRLKELGCRIAIDDFGIGHATLEYIRRFSMADALKIDRSFVAGLDTSREDTAIVDASIALASSLGLQVIAEGVEDLEQLHGLRQRGARYAQGYALARPMPLDQNLALWRRQRLYEPPWGDEAELQV
jgi:diguanylate cyclase (GGDEF)-like protein